MVHNTEIFPNDTLEIFSGFICTCTQKLNVNDCYLEIWGFARLHKHRGVH